MNNQLIGISLHERRDEAIAAFQLASNVHPRLQEAFAALANFDFTAYSQQLHSELVQNSHLWHEKPVSSDNSIDAILFEFNSIYEDAVDARAYGVIDWQKPVLHVAGFDMGYDFDFRKGFDAVPGISLHFLQPLEDLLNPDAIDELVEPDRDMEDVPGFQSLVNSFLFSGLSVIHRVLVESNLRTLFTKAGLKPDGLVVLGGHDTGLVYPLFSMSAD